MSAFLEKGRVVARDPSGRLHPHPCTRCQFENKPCEYTAGRGKSCFRCLSSKLSCSFNKEPSINNVRDLTWSISDMCERLGDHFKDTVKMLKTESAKYHSSLEQFSTGIVSMGEELKAMREDRQAMREDLGKMSSCMERMEGALREYLDKGEGSVSRKVDKGKGKAKEPSVLIRRPKSPSEGSESAAEEEEEEEEGEISTLQ